MNYIAYIARFLFRIKWWLILCPLIVAFLIYTRMGSMPRRYHSSTTIYTGIVSGYDIETTEQTRQDWNIINNALDNLINIITSQTTLKNVSMRLYAQGLVHADRTRDNRFLTARSSQLLLDKTPPEVMKLVDRSTGIDSIDERRTMENLMAFEQADRENHVYGIFQWTHPHYSYEALSRIKVKHIGSSDMLEISYENDDPKIVFNTLEILNEEFVNQYHDLRFSQTNKVIKFFEGELERVGTDLLNLENSLRDYSVDNRVINYDEQTKHIAALTRDFELRYEEILLNYESARKLRLTSEEQMKGQLEMFKNNASFIAKLNNVGDLYSRLSAAEAFSPSFDDAPDDTTLDSPLAPKPKSRVDKSLLQQRIDTERSELEQITAQIASQQYTKEGIAASSIVAAWLDALLLEKKSGAELEVMKLRKEHLDQQYVQFSPIGSTLKRRNREIDFSKQSYLSILNALNTARLKQKNLQMISATLKIINPPVLPIGAEPTKRKLYVAAGGVGTLLFVLAFFILLELLDRTLRDKVRTERITDGRVIGAFPGNGSLGQRRYAKQYREIAARKIGNAVLGYFDPARRPNIVNVISNDRGDGKTTVMEQLAEHFRETGMQVATRSWNSDFDARKKEYLLASDYADFLPRGEDGERLGQADVLLVELPPLSEHSIPRELLQNASLNLLVTPANRTWKDTDQLLFEKITALAGKKNVMICLNCATREVVQTFTGLLPPYNRLRRLGYQISQFGFTAVK